MTKINGCLFTCAGECTCLDYTSNISNWIHFEISCINVITSMEKSNRRWNPSFQFYATLERSTQSKHKTREIFCYFFSFKLLSFFVDGIRFDRFVKFSKRIRCVTCERERLADSARHCYFTLHIEIIYYVPMRDEPPHLYQNWSCAISML